MHTAPATILSNILQQTAWDMQGWNVPEMAYAHMTHSQSVFTTGKKEVFIYNT